MNDTSNRNIDGHSEHLLDAELLDRVKSRFALADTVSNDLDGLRQVYAAWCTNVPFDNIRKMISLREGLDAKLAGLDAADFFENWLANGSGGTCWPSSNALFSLLTTLGFNARRVAGSMFDIPDINHGTIKVNLDGQDWLVDSSMLTYEPFPLTDSVFIKDGTANPVEVEPDNGSYVIWADFPPMPEFIPCRLHTDPVDDDFYHERYEIYSRGQSPFNQKLYLRKGGPEGVSVVFGNTVFKRNGDGLDVREFDRDGLCAYLVDEAGISNELVERWAASGSLDLTFDTIAGGTAPEITRPRPSKRS